ncbi:MAG TPA: hypothetical protein VNA25_05965 [Phycisphaerae bacterium]|nr:hypothetical protein [Phycisphaerae bacterium]
MPATWDDPVVKRRPVTVWDIVSAILILLGLGALIGAMLTMWLTGGK